MAVDATGTTVVTNLTNKEMANTRAAAGTTEIPAIITATPVMVHSPEIITAAVNKATAVNRVVMTGAMKATGAMAAIAITVIIKGIAMGTTGIVQTVTIIAGNVNTDVALDFCFGS